MLSVHIHTHVELVAVPGSLFLTRKLCLSYLISSPVVNLPSSEHFGNFSCCDLTPTVNTEDIPEE